MRTIDDVLRSIENAKLDVPSNEYINVKMDDLEMLYANISHNCDILNAQDAKIEILQEQLTKSRDNNKLLNNLLKVKAKQLDTYS